MRIIEKLIRQQVAIDKLRFGFILGNGSTNIIFISRQLHEKYFTKNKNLYFAFVDLEKPFD